MKRLSFQLKSGWTRCLNGFPLDALPDWVRHVEVAVGLETSLREALKAPLAITRNGRDRLVILSVDEYERLKGRDRQALAVEELSDTETESIRRAEPPVEAARYDHEVSAQGRGTT